MSQCVPSWDADENPTPPRVPLRNSNSNSTTPPNVTMLDYEVAELTWENGQPSMHGLGLLPRVPAKPLNTAAAATGIPSKNSWEKPRGSGTLESIVNQATRLPHHCKSTLDGVAGAGAGAGGYGNELVPWFDPHRGAAVLAAAAAASNTVTMDALVPCSNRTDEQGMESAPGGLGKCMVGCSTPVASCGGPTTQEGDGLFSGRHATAAHVPVAHELSSRDQSVSGSATFGRDSQHTYERELGVGFTSASTGSLENTSAAKKCTKTTATDDHDSVCHSTQQAKLLL